MADRSAAAAKSLSCVRLCVTPKTAAHQATLSLGFSRQEHWSGLPFPSPVHESEKWKWSLSVVSDSYWPLGLQPTRLLCPWDFPGKSTGVGCHCFLRIVRSGWGFQKGLSVAPPVRVGTLKTKQNEIVSALSGWHQSSQTFWFFLNAQMLLPHCSEWQVFKGTEGPVWCSLPSFHTWPGDCEHPGAGLGNHVVHMRSHGCIHPWGQDALTSLGQWLFEFPACHYSSCKCRTGN